MTGVRIYGLGNARLKHVVADALPALNVFPPRNLFDGHRTREPGMALLARLQFPSTVILSCSYFNSTIFFVIEVPPVCS
jgi:hypothetical protein